MMDYQKFDPYNDDAFWAEVARDSEARRADPLPFALEALDDLFGVDPSQGLRRWRSKMEMAIWWADDAIQCIEKVLAAPPANLGQLIRDRGIRTWVKRGDSEELGDAQAHVDWLRDMAVQLRAAFEAFLVEKNAELAAERAARGEAE